MTGAAVTRFVAGWSPKAALIAGTALSTTSLAVVYSVLGETGLAKTEIGKLIMASTFVTDMGTALALRHSPGFSGTSSPMLNIPSIWSIGGASVAGPWKQGL